MIPTHSQLLSNFLSCLNWEEKYIYIMDLGQLLPKFPEVFRVNKYLTTGCQSYTWIKLVNNDDRLQNKNEDKIIQFYGDSEAAIVRGIIVIIFSLYQNLDIQSVINYDVYPFLNQLQLTQHLTVSRSQGLFAILRTIHKQAHELLLKTKSTICH